MNAEEIFKNATVVFQRVKLKFDESEIEVTPVHISSDAKEFNGYVDLSVTIEMGKLRNDTSKQLLLKLLSELEVEHDTI